MSLIQVAYAIVMLLWLLAAMQGIGSIIGEFDFIATSAMPSMNAAPLRAGWPFCLSAAHLRHHAM
ncbi:MAG: hypothetical protein IPK83_22735 [Planctomycetes bacterium]|nr:hypothetical protein [Planctomycetota bacterium]